MDNVVSINYKLAGQISALCPKATGNKMKHTYQAKYFKGSELIFQKSSKGQKQRQAFRGNV